MHGIIQCMFDCWTAPFVHLLQLKSSMNLQDSSLTSFTFGQSDVPRLLAEERRCAVNHLPNGRDLETFGVVVTSGHRLGKLSMFLLLYIGPKIPLSPGINFINLFTLLIIRYV